MKGAEAPRETALGLAGFRPLIPSRHQAATPTLVGTGRRVDTGLGRGTPSHLQLHLHSGCPRVGQRAMEGLASPAGLSAQKGKPEHRWVTWSGSVWFWFCLTALCSCHPTSTRSPGPGL